MLLAGVHILPTLSSIRAAVGIVVPLWDAADAPVGEKGTRRRFSRMAATARPRKVGQEESVGILYSDSDTSIGDPRFARFRGISLIWVNFAFRSRQTQGEIGKALWPSRGNRLAQRIEMRHAAL